MKLLRAKISNFRLLKDLELIFSASNDKPLTIIRAANESGKTTCEYALMWGLWGKEGLSIKKDNEYKIFSNFEEESNATAPEVEIDFQTDSDANNQVKKYRLNRKVIFKNKDNMSDELSIFEMKNSGHEKIVNEHDRRQIINSVMPLSLKDIYFTDGDRALSFIEASATTSIKQKRVKNAIRSLLSLDVLESTIRHLNSVQKKFEDEIDDTDYATQLKNLNAKISFRDGEIEELNEEIEELEKVKSYAEINFKQANSKVEDILKQGDKSKLLQDKQRIERELEFSQRKQVEHVENLRKLTQNENVSLVLLKNKFEISQEFLKNLKDKKQLPKTSVPILEELLTKTACFCGASLDENTLEGQKSRKFISQVLDDSNDADKKTELATNLFYASYKSNADSAAQKWKANYNKYFGDFLNFEDISKNKSSQLMELENQIDNINDDALKIYKVQCNEYNDKLSKAIFDIGAKNAQVQSYMTENKEYDEEKQKIQKRLNKTDSSTNKVMFARSLKDGLTNILKKLNDEEIDNVSHEMNRIFLEMIGSSADKNAFSSITRAELTKTYEILVYGGNGVKINPDQDLNGASRRAITIAFILALTKVSQVEAPNVIDTPLGMMSGYVKQSVLNQLVKEGSQTILFLTHDEINGVETIIDQYAGKVCTLTNPAHYPRMLKHKPDVADTRIIKCKCNHKEFCSICERKDLGVA